MYSADDLIGKLRDLEILIREKANPDGCCEFDALRVMVSLELARRMISGEENCS